jgi:putative transposase
MRWVATTKSIDAGMVGDLMMQAVEYRFDANTTTLIEIEWLSDNGSCYTDAETVQEKNQFRINGKFQQ